jgi:Na+/H+-dicarboxylate symporter
MSSTMIGTGARWSPERRFYTGMGLAMFAAMYLGFAPSFFLKPWFPEAHGAPEPFFYVHGAIFAAWFVLLIVQPSLVGIGRTDLHRRLGRVGAILAVAMVVTGTVGALIAARRPTGFVDIPIPPLQFMVVPLFDMLLFALLVGLAIALRNDPQSHKRLMLIASSSLLVAAIARWPHNFRAHGPVVFFAVSDLFLLAMVAWDYASRRKIHPATLWAGLLIVASQPLRLALSGTEAWLSFAGWAVGLLGP